MEKRKKKSETPNMVRVRVTGFGFRAKFKPKSGVPSKFPLTCETPNVFSPCILERLVELEPQKK